jgi:hypothetical protein
VNVHCPAGDLRLLALLSHLPLSTVGHLASLDGGLPVATYRRLARLAAAGMIAWATGPRMRGRPPRLMYATGRGLHLLASSVPTEGISLLCTGAGVRRRHVRAVPSLLQLYDLLALLAASVDGVARLVAWEEPWRRVFAIADGRQVVARAPAMAELTWTRGGDLRAMTDRFLLLPDISRLAAASGRSLRALAQLQRLGEDVPNIVVAADDAERAHEWDMLLERAGFFASVQRV